MFITWIKTITQADLTWFVCRLSFSVYGSLFLHYFSENIQTTCCLRWNEEVRPNFRSCDSHELTHQHIQCKIELWNREQVQSRIKNPRNQLELIRGNSSNVLNFGCFGFLESLRKLQFQTNFQQWQHTFKHRPESITSSFNFNTHTKKNNHKFNSLIEIVAV